MDDRPHSAAYFGPERDFWWNLDHLELLATRRGLHSVRSVLDVGSGIGHWGMLLGRVLDAEVVGVEREPQWVAEAKRRAQELGLPCRYVEGVAEALPFDDGSFDLVTCQTVLIHVSDPLAVIREMLRVTRPGGQVVVAEPNNRASSVVAHEDPRDVLDFVVTCERGKIALGEGNNSVGDYVPGYFTQAGLVDIDVWLADKPEVLFPPYAAPGQRERAEAARREAATGWGGWTPEQARRYFEAGGGIRFEDAWARRMAEARAIAAAIDAGTYHTAGGTLLYLVAGRRAGAQRELG
jgi:SAM-dependent methyltransferase